jgi:hypothetical protein
MPDNANFTNTERDLLVDDHPWDAPWPAPWRELYERIVPLAWPLVVRPLAAHGADRRAYLHHEVERRLRSVAEHLAYAVMPLADQEALLTAASELWGVPSPCAEPALRPSGVSTKGTPTRPGRRWNVRPESDSPPCSQAYWSPPFTARPPMT